MGDTINDPAPCSFIIHNDLKILFINVSTTNSALTPLKLKTNPNEFDKIIHRESWPSISNPYSECSKSVSISSSISTPWMLYSSNMEHEDSSHQLTQSITPSIGDDSILSIDE